MISRTPEHIFRSVKMRQYNLKIHVERKSVFKKICISIKTKSISHKESYTRRKLYFFTLIILPVHFENTLIMKPKMQLFKKNNNKNKNSG